MSDPEREALRDVDAAWEALMADIGHPNTRFVTARHRPLIEAALRAALSPGPEPVADPEYAARLALNDSFVEGLVAGMNVGPEPVAGLELVPDHVWRYQQGNVHLAGCCVHPGAALGEKP